MDNLITDLFIVINEGTLNTMKGAGGKTAFFKTKEEANISASQRLNMWVVVHINFHDKFLQHTV